MSRKGGFRTGVAILPVAALLVSCQPAFFTAKTAAPVEKAQAVALSRLRKSLAEIPPGRYPIRTRGAGPWELTEPSAWTSGFFPGCLWLARRLSGDSSWIAPARERTEGLESQQFNRDTHDIGFMMLSSFGNGYRLLGDVAYRGILLQSAESLASRFNEKAGCLQSWDGEFQVIIDNMMNLEILFWAARHGGRPELGGIAVRHANTTLQNHLREDGGSFHVVVFDTATGAVLEKRTAQGFDAGSTWARGQAWGVYGFTVCFRETRNPAYLDAAVRMADYFLSHLPADAVPFWDLNLPDDCPRRFRDASAAAIALSALLELRAYVEDPSEYDGWADRIMAALVRSVLAKDGPPAGILRHCAYNVNSRNPHDWDASTAWGDYYFLEALGRYGDFKHGAGIRL